MTAKEMIDLPPVWLALFAGLAGVQAWLLPLGGAAPWIGGALVGLGLVIMGTSFVEFRRHRTSVIPHQAPSALITTGIYRVSRNPIYLADVIILAGLCLRWGAWPSLLLVPVFMAVITARFIKPEEARLRAAFGPEFEAWAARTRRWA